ncbi:MAG TPA: tRNA 2-thiouridine(34) synthase MnmA [Elusimicrobiota bacterium]|nr:tRNA 2-thiouridine(34) synthase MnmA [Elusimicrobiota bacterium]
MKNVLVGMSGGVDSTVTAHLLNKAGHRVVGVAMRIWGDPAIPTSGTSPKKSACYGPGERGDIRAAEKAARSIGIPFHVFDLSEDFKKKVVERYRSVYLSGQTPNPCVICNRELKFGLLLEEAKRRGLSMDLFATGHYARITEEEDGRYFLRRAADARKDQSYFLYQLTQEQLKRTMFPLGGLSKDEVKRIAAEIGLKDYAEKPESQDFYEGDHADLFSPDENVPGDIVDSAGRTLGRHDGIIHYTIGQRKGLNLGGLHEPYYVIGIDGCRNRVIVGKKEQLSVKEFYVQGLNWIVLSEMNDSFAAMVKVRAQSSELSCRLFPRGPDRVQVVFDEPQLSITPGQSAVFYRDDVVLGGGVIQKNPV